MPESGPTRVVIVAPVLPYDAITHAGGIYLRNLHCALVEAGADVTFLAHDNEFSREALVRPGGPRRAELLGLSQRRSILERVVMRAAYNLDAQLHARRPGWPPLPFVVQLMLSARARRIISTADVVDLEWPEYARLVPLIRLLNRRALVVATLHDVLSQRLARAAEAAGEGDVATAAAGGMIGAARRLERATTARADVVVVFSHKDRALLLTDGASSRADIAVVTPPLAPPDPHERQLDASAPAVVFVALWTRPENEDAGLWLLGEIWPSVSARVPSARLRLVGTGVSSAVRDAAAAAQNVEVPGFVPDLDEVYAQASASVVPLRLGAGVKFKTVESLVAGVPTVTTTIGAEGIAGPERFAALTDDPVELADALVAVLQDPVGAEAQAAATQAWARERYSMDRFRREVERIYRLEGDAS